jgi:hypothetical protein
MQTLEWARARRYLIAHATPCSTPRPSSGRSPGRWRRCAATAPGARPTAALAEMLAAGSSSSTELVVELPYAVAIAIRPG